MRTFSILVILLLMAAIVTGKLDDYLRKYLPNPPGTSGGPGVSPPSWWHYFDIYPFPFIGASHTNVKTLNTIKVQST